MINCSVPLAVRNKYNDNTMELEILTNSDWQQIPLPFYPYCYVKQCPQSPDGNDTLQIYNAINITPVKMRSFKQVLNTNAIQDLLKCEFPSTKYVAQLNNLPQFADILYESHIQYPIRVAIDLPDFYRQFPSVIKPIMLDIEAIDVAGSKQILVGIKPYKQKPIQIWLTKHNPVQTSKLIYNTIKQHGNLIVGYNVINYDIAMLNEYMEGTQKIPDLPAFDIAEAVFSDQSLFGIKSRDMKTVAEWFGLPVMRFDFSNLNNVDLDELEIYNKSDLEISEKLFDIYFPVLKYQAEYVGIPLNLLFDFFASTVPSILCARILKKLNIVTEGHNTQRGLPLTFRGAVVDIKTNDVINVKPVYKLDFKQMYPSIVINCNLSPEKVQFEGVDYNAQHGTDVNVIRFDNGILQYNIYDEIVGGVCKICVDINTQGELVKQLIDMGIERDKYKKLYKQTKNPEYDSIQTALKVMRNCFIGYFGSNSAYFANKASAIIVTAVGRYLIRSLEKKLTECGCNVIEIDTDGIYFTANDTVDVKNVTYNMIVYINQCFKELLYGNQRVSDYIGFELELEKYEAGLFVANKNYILLDDNNRIVVKGAGLKGTHRPKLWDEVLYDIIKRKFATNEYVKLSDYINKLHSYPIDYFVMRRNIKKTKFKSNCLSATLLSQLTGDERRNLNKSGFVIVEYYKAVDGYKLLRRNTQNNYNIDYHYYSVMLFTLFQALGFDIDVDIKHNVTPQPKSSTLFDENAETIPCHYCGGSGYAIKPNSLEEQICPHCGGSGVLSVYKH